jgi:hypothetical protein
MTSAILKNRMASQEGALSGATGENEWFRKNLE